MKESPELMQLSRYPFVKTPSRVTICDFGQFNNCTSVCSVKGSLAAVTTVSKVNFAVSRSGSKADSNKLKFLPGDLHVLSEDSSTHSINIGIFESRAHMNLGCL